MLGVVAAGPCALGRLLDCHILDKPFDLDSLLERGQSAPGFSST
jgi:hypothetical protein